MNTEKFRQFLIQGFSEHELYDFCFDTPQFRTVVDELGYGKPKGHYARRMLELCEQKLPDRSYWNTLTTWAKEQNPARYRSMVDEN